MHCLVCIYLSGCFPGKIIDPLVLAIGRYIRCQTFLQKRYAAIRIDHNSQSAGTSLRITPLLVLEVAEAVDTAQLHEAIPSIGTCHRWPLSQCTEIRPITPKRHSPSRKARLVAVLRTHLNNNTPIMRTPSSVMTPRTSRLTSQK